MAKKKGKRTVFILIGVALATFGIGYLAIKWRDIFPKKPTESGTTPTTGITLPSGKGCTNPSFFLANDKLPLKKGSKGTKVEVTQSYLLKLGADLGKGGADGLFGCYTLRELIKYENVEQVSSALYTEIYRKETGEIKFF